MVNPVSSAADWAAGPLILLRLLLHVLIWCKGMKLSQNSFGTTGLTTCGSYWSVRKFISPICKHENEKLLHGYKNIYYTGQ